MSNSHAIKSTFGFHTPADYSIRLNKDSKVNNSLVFFHNALNLCDGFPIVSRISGLARLIFTAIVIITKLSSGGKLKNNEKIWAVTEAARGVASALGFGVLFVIPDFLFTIQSHFEKQEKTLIYFQGSRFA